MKFILLILLLVPIFMFQSFIVIDLINEVKRNRVKHKTTRPVLTNNVHGLSYRTSDIRKKRYRIVK